MPLASEFPTSAGRWQAPLVRGLRIVAAIGGGYLLVALAVTAAGAWLARWGMARSEAVALASMLGFVVYLIWLLWAFAARSAGRVWIVLASGLALLYLLQG